jgi:hypothetical protein
MMFAQEHYRLAVFRIDWKTSKFITEKYQFFYSFIVIALVTCEFTYCGFILSSQDVLLPAKQKVFAVILIMEFILTVICALYMITSAVFRRKSQIKFFEKIIEIDEVLLKKIDVKIDYKFFKRISEFSLFLILFFYNVIMAGLLFSYRPGFSFKVSSANNYAILIVYIIQATASAIFAHGYVGCVFMIYQRICGAIEKLEKIIERERNEVNFEVIFHRLEYFYGKLIIYWIFENFPGFFVC